ncbi:hypothetical protein FACS1894122_02770 [Alphaproteobacteria bacterium]|nr:hypothetical protein FACS1894122_02770 [Alphaproteobacteria bacterium]
MHWTMNLLLSLVFLLTSCSREQSRVYEPKKEVAVDRSAEERLLKLDRNANGNLILLLLPLSGTHAEIGKGILNACMLFSDEHKDCHANFRVVDTSDPNTENYKLYNSFKHSNLKGIIGPVFFNEAKQYGALFPKASIFTLSNNTKVNNNHVFSCGISPRDEIHAIFSFAKNNGLDDFLVMLPENELGDQLLKYIDKESKRSFSEYGDMEIIRYKSMSRQDAARIVANSKKNAVFLVDPLIDPQEFGNIHVFTLGTSAFANRNDWDGAYFAFSKNQQLDDFTEKYQKTFGGTPGTLSIIGYDICNLLHGIITDGMDEDSFYSEHEGCMGSFLLKKNKGMIRRLSIVRLENGTVKSLE